jgi:tol-pal system protein YbgF
MKNGFMKKRLIVAWLSLCFAGFASTAQAGLFDDEEARKAILDLRAKVEANNTQRLADLRTQTDEIAQLRRAMLDLNNAIEALRADLARNRGAQEQQTQAFSTLANDVATLQKRQKDVLQATEDRLKQLEPTQVTVDGKTAVVDPAEKRTFDAALALFKGSEFVRAAPAFNEFIGRYPRSVYSPAAYYYLGNTHYGQKDCRLAIEAFMALSTRYPEDARSPEALLSAGNCHLEMGDKRAARRVYESLVKLYPQVEEAGTAKERITRIK